LSKRKVIWSASILVVIIAAGFFVWKRFGPSSEHFYSEVKHTDLVAKTIDSASHACQLTVQRYKQIGREIQFELASSASGLAPYDVEISQNNLVQKFPGLPHRAGIWLTVPFINLTGGTATIRVKSLGQPGCETVASFEYNGKAATEILDSSKWVRQGSSDMLLDVRVVQNEGKVYLKDFADYRDGRTKVLMIDGIAVKDLERGIEVRPGYLYSVTGRWIDAPFNDWWNKLRNRTVRQQNIWIKPVANAPEVSSLAKISAPPWFSLSDDIHINFDTQFPEFQPIAGKLVAQYRSNDWVSPQNYFNRGIGYLHASEKDLPSQKLHWTATPNLFEDRDQDWFATLNRAQVEAYADQTGDLGIYAMDFEFWNQIYTPEVKQRLIWYAERLRKNHPNLLVFDYWGGAPYHNKHISSAGKVKPMDLINDYNNPKPNHTNFDPLPNGESFRSLFGITPVDVYPKAMYPMDEAGNTVNNFVLLSAIHSLRINKLISFQKNNKFIFYAWNRYQPLYQDPPIPWSIKTTDPKGELVLTDLEMMPASQALSMSLFSLFLFDGYYLWSDGQPVGKGINGYNPSKDGDGFGREWHPADSKTSMSAFRTNPSGHDSPWFWDFPTQYFMLGNWMAKQVEDIIVGGKNQDLQYEINGNWRVPVKGQALIAADKKEPFVSALVNGNKIAIIAVDCFQSPTTSRKLKIRLPDGTEDTIEMYGNWPVLYRGTLKK
jgi:hypothetical protein